MELIYTSPNNGLDIYITFPISFILSLWIAFKLRNMGVREKLAGAVFTFIIMVSQIDAKNRMDDIQSVINSNCSVKNCTVVIGNVARFKTYKNKLKKSYQTNEFYIDKHKFIFDETEEAFCYDKIAEKGGALTPNSGRYKLYVYSGKIIKLWRLAE